MSKGQAVHNNSIEKYVLPVLFLMAVWVNVKSIFMEFDIDSEYALAMSYRMLQGDGMFREMWEPHQTSAFLMTLLMKPFVAITGGVTGVALYLQTMGVLLHCGVVWCFYCFMKKRVDLRTAKLMSIVFLAVRPKDLPLPEFSNMQLWFSVLLFLSLLYYLEHQERKLWLLLSSIFLCLEVISYPSCVIVWLGVVMLLWVYAAGKWKDILLFTACCAVQGFVYTGWYVMRAGGVGAFLEVLQNIVASDSSHQKGGTVDFEGFWLSLLLSALWLVACALVAYVISGRHRRSAGLLLTAIFMLITLGVRGVFSADHAAHIILYPLLILWAVSVTRRSTSSEKRIVYAGVTISVSTVIATGLLTNLGISATLMYLILGVLVSMIPLGGLQVRRLTLGKKVFGYEVIVLFALVVLFQRSILVKTPGGFASPLNIGSIVRSGPAVGILSDYMGAYTRNTSYNEWAQFVREGDNILLVEKDAMSTLGYLYGDTGVSIPSVICTPSFDESLLRYWEKYPEKYPDVVAVQCSYGNLILEEDSWIMQWLHRVSLPEKVSEGTFWRFYRLK